MSILNVLYRKRGFNDQSRDTFYTTVSMCTVIVLETAIGVSVPCMSSCAKVFGRWSGALRPYFQPQHGGYQDVSLSGKVREIQQEPARPEAAVRKPEQDDLDTIDQWLGQSKSTYSGHDDLTGMKSQPERWV